jgi:hypothetical protein
MYRCIAQLYHIRQGDIFCYTKPSLECFTTYVEVFPSIEVDIGSKRVPKFK